MARKTEIVANCRFERAGMGLAPFTLRGVEEKVYIACPGATPQAAGTCDFCGTGIRYVFHIESSDGKKWGVGCDCVRHTQDAGLIRRATSEQRLIDRRNRHAREDRKIEDLKNWFYARAEKAKSIPSPNARRAEEFGETLFNCVEWYLSNAGRSGSIGILKIAKKKLESVA